MMGKLKKTAKSAYTYFYNWRSIMRFSSFGKGSFLGRRLTVNFSGGVYLNWIERPHRAGFKT